VAVFPAWWPSTSGSPFPKNPHFAVDVERNVRQATDDIENVISSGSYYVDPDAAIQRVQAPKASRRGFLAHFSKWENFKILFGAAYSWFALDVSRFVMFSQGCFLDMCGSRSLSMASV
jgi:hypothetical protein